MESACDVIARRASIHSFDGRRIAADVRERLADYLRRLPDAPFGSPVQATLVKPDDAALAELAELTLYGSVEGASEYLVGWVRRGRRAMEDFGFVFEHAVLYAVALGLGTCWLSGTFRGSRIADQIDLMDDYVVPCLTPVGYPAEQPEALDRPAKHAATPRRRKRFEELFHRLEFWEYDGEPQGPAEPIRERNAGRYGPVFRAVQAAPSASNHQPWRLYRYTSEGEGGTIHLFLERTPGYAKAAKDIDVQRIDAGVAMAHVSLAASECGIQGEWRDERPEFVPEGLEYIASWHEQ